MHSKRSRVRASFATVAAILLSLLTLSAHADGNVEVVASGLDSPRGIAINQRGDVYVVEAGRGGSGACVPNVAGLPQCFGLSGAITRIRHGDVGQQERIVTGLPSQALADGSDALGPHDLLLRNDRSAWLTIGLGGDVARRNTLGNAKFGTLVRVNLDNRWGTDHDMESDEDERGNVNAGASNGSAKLTILADILGYEAMQNPDGGRIDTNPFGLAYDRANQLRLVADSGGNALLGINEENEVKTLAVFPNRVVPSPFSPTATIPMQAVPTAVVVGPDGAYYVGQLTGFPFPVGGARVYRVVPGQEPTIYADGFTNIIDIGFDKTGRLHVLEIDKNSLRLPDPTGALIRLNADGSQTELLSQGLNSPGGFAFGHDGAIYISVCTNCVAGQGQVVRYKP